MSGDNTTDICAECGAVEIPMIGYDNSVGNRQSRQRKQVPETVWISPPQPKDGDLDE